MDRRAVCISWLVILALVLLAGPGLAASSLAGGTASIDVARQLMPSSLMRLEDGVAPELAVDLGLHRRVLAGIDPGAGPLNANKPACKPKCAEPGQPNTGPGCLKIYGCRGGS